MWPKERNPLMATAPLPHPRQAGDLPEDDAGRWVVISLLLTPDGRASVNGRRIDVPDQNARLHMLVEAGRIASQLGRDIGVTATDPSGTHYFVAHGDGTFEPVGEAPWATASQTVAVPSYARPPEPGPDPSDWPTIDTLLAPSPGAEGDVEQDAGRQGPGLTGPWQPPPHRSPRRGPFPGTAGASRLTYSPVTVGAGIGLAALLTLAIVVIGVLTMPEGDGERGRRSVAASTRSSPPSRAASRGPTEPSDTAPALPPVPEGLPGFTRQAAWSVPVGDFTGVSYLDGRLALRDADGRLSLVDATSGRAIWRGGAPWPSEWTGPILSRIDGQPALVLASRSQVAYVELGSLDGGRPASSNPAEGGADGLVEVALPAGGRVIWTGTTPLVTDGAKAWLVKGSSLRPMTLPAQARPVTANGDTVIAVAGRSWVRSTGGTYDTHAIATPAGVKGAPARVVDVAGRFLLVVWPKQRPAQAISLIDTGSGLALLNSRLPAGVDVTKASVLRDASGSMTAVGQVIVDIERQRVNALLPQYTPRALASGRVYAADAAVRAPDNIVEVRLPEFTVSRLGPQAPTPLTVSPPADGRPATAFIIVTTSRGRQLLAVPETR
jgi:hypothetical protein